jgi:signal transduction histidine kinase
VAVECVLPNNPLVVDADAAQLRQVTLNLLLNALDAVPNGGSIWVEVTLDRRAESEPEPIDQNQPRVRLKVSDNGRGLLALDRDRIYEPFFSTKETGLGLGLAITQRIVRAHGGQLNASDRGGGGAAFEVVLPVATPAVV